ncbi:MAG: caspase family protein [Bacteroidia bacterium]|nr:caspase family protein [Bacteroidia bacterium]MDW8235451.1 caspase family protein [Bacteroidia bacterium]
MKRLLSVIGLLWAQPYKDLEGHMGSINALAFSADSRYLLSASSDRTVRLWHLPYGTLLARYTGASASLNALTLLEDTTGTFWCASSDGQVYQWSLAQYWHGSKGSREPSLRTQRRENIARRLRKGTGYEVWEAIAAHPKRPTLYVLSRTGKLVAWDTSENWLQTLQDTTGVSYALAIAASGKTLYVGSGSGVIWAVSTQDFSIQRTLRGHTKGVRGLAISPDERLLASAGLDGKVMLWRIPEGLRIQTLEANTEGMRAVAFSPDGRFLAGAGKDGKLFLWHVNTGRLEKSLTLSVPLWTVAFCPNGQYLIAGGEEGLLRVWRIDQLGIRPIQVLAETDSLYTPPVDIEDNIPQCGKSYAHRYAFIVGNEDYRSYNLSFTPAMNVPYAVKDAYAFRMYVEQILGVPSRNIVFLQNATAAQFQRELEKLILLFRMGGGKAELFFYYAGHGVPHPQTQESYLLPVDVAPSEGGIRLTDVVQKLGESGARRIWMIVDACFSGGAREESPMAARGIRIKPKPIQLTGPVILLSATTAEEEALPYHQARHGLFTYFFLKALRQKGCREATLQSLLEETVQETTRYALLLHHRLQRPTWLVSPALSETEVLSERW